MSPRATSRAQRHSDLCALGVALLTFGACHAASRAQSPPPGFDPAPIERQTPRLAGPDNPALTTELTRLRRLALASPAVAGSRGAAWELALLHLNGIATSNSADARRWLQTARALGEPMAAAGLAWCAIDGCDGPPDPAEARRWIAALRPVDLPRAQLLEWLLNERLAPTAAPPHTASVEATRRMAGQQRELLARAARGGSAAARVELGFNHLADGRIADAEQSFDRAATQSPAAAANALLLRERLSPLPRAKARGAVAGGEWLTAARRAHRGEGVPANYTEAIRLYQLAAQAGNAEARRMLGLIVSRPAPGGQIDIAWMRDLAGLDVSTSLPRVEGAALSGTTLQRDPTPLFDLLPRRWRDDMPTLR